MQKKIDHTVLIRRMQESDVNIVTHIENEVARDPWSRNLFSSCLKVYDSFVAILDNGSVVGFGIIAIYSSINEAHIINLAVDQCWHCNGIGSQLLRFLIDSCPIGHNKIFLEVNENNQSAINLYKKFGFVFVGIRKNYYNTKNGKENALVFLLSSKN